MSTRGPSHDHADALYSRAKGLLSVGGSVVIDATFRSAAERLRAYELAEAAGANFYFIECAASEEEVKKRLEKRLEDSEVTVSDGRWELFEGQKEEWEPATELPSASYIRLSTNGPLEENIRTLLGELFRKMLSTDSSA